MIDGDSSSVKEHKKDIEDHYLVDVAFDGDRGDYLAQVNDYAAIVIESNIPDMQHHDLCKKARENAVSAPILMLLDGKNPDQVETCLDSGADMVLTKPVSKKELVAYLRSMIRRNHRIVGANTLKVGDLKLHLKRKEVHRGRKKIDLRRKEFEILEYLMINQGRVVSKENILEHVWEYGLEAASNTLEVHIKTLRDRVDRPFGNPLIKTVRGFGYKISS